MDMASFLEEICEVLDERATSSRELAALEFEAEGRDISIRVRRELHGRDYPALGTILGRIGRTCLEQGIAVPHLSRIAFLPDEVRVELAGSAHQPGKIYRYPIEGMADARAPEPASLLLAAKDGSGGSRPTAAPLT